MPSTDTLWRSAKFSIHTVLQILELFLSPLSEAFLCFSGGETDVQEDHHNFQIHIPTVWSYHPPLQKQVFCLINSAPQSLIPPPTQTEKLSSSSRMRKGIPRFQGIIYLQSAVSKMEVSYWRINVQLEWKETEPIIQKEDIKSEHQV